MAPASSLSLLAHVVVLVAFFVYPCAAQSRVVNISAVEAAVRDRAFELIRRTSQLVDVPLPLAGVAASALRMRSNALWADGVNATAGPGPGGPAFAVPPRVVPAPFARRVAIVFELFLVNNDDGAGPHSTLHRAARAVSLRATGAPVRVEFANATSAAARNFNATTARCVTFAASGEVVATHAMLPGTAACAVTGTGRFGVAVPAETPPRPVAVRTRWWAWTAVVGACGVLGASFVALSVAGAVWWCRRRRREEMELRAMAGEELGRMTVRGSRMPSAKLTRTQPEVEEGSPLPWRGRASS
ncbi:hypothetical protein PR202_gb17828 [Eleusine coracana subsp. coracana]|uniref:Uncharacterized protein n=1 Tax=Eleusine coracana subsp. coracana TaxID=191504 RepID=A0AAV5F1Q7_ELECO|nr:hypothetical protein PR202_gb17828 [Eleusine coracana subsp. coracana]